MKILNNTIANSIGMPLDMQLWKPTYTQLDRVLRHRLEQRIYDPLNLQLHIQLCATLINQIHSPFELRVNFKSNHGK